MAQLDAILSQGGQPVEELLKFSNPRFGKERLHLPGPDWTNRIWQQSDRNPQVLRSLGQLYGTGRLANTGYLSILPVDQGIEHSAGASFAVNPIYFDPENIIKLAIEANCNAVASTLGVLGIVSREYAHRIPFLVKLNHNELLSYPNQHDQTLYGSVKQAWNMGAAAIGATVYFGSPDSRRQLWEVSQMFAAAHELGMATVLWCYVRNSGFSKDGVNYETADDLSSQANHLGVTIEADIIKQKLPEISNGYGAVKFGKTDKKVYDSLTSAHPIDMTRYQVLNCYAGRASLINSGGDSKGSSDLGEALYTAVVNKRAGGSGLILGRKAFKREIDEGVALLQSVQDVYLCDQITIA
ncbi:MAG TPA: class I fructose-bisphosphate aldolase [Deltaproteobacteria bacterium]|nr:class I fructose-bisphosphate aldolase [Deltaproteobacteria bacterium]